MFGSSIGSTQKTAEVKVERYVKDNRTYFTEIRLRGKVYPRVREDVEKLDVYLRRKRGKVFVIQFETFNIVGVGESNLFLRFDDEAQAWFGKSLKFGNKMMYFDKSSILIFLNKSCNVDAYLNFFKKLDGIYEFAYLGIEKDVYEITL